MSRTALPVVRFDRGLLIKRHLATFGQSKRDVHVLVLIGLVGEAQEPFWLWYRDGLTQWESREHLGQPLRRKVLQLLRTTCRYTEKLPSFIKTHDLRAQDAADLEIGHKANEALELAFHKCFKAEYLKEIPQQFIVLEVPFSEKDEAKKFGATWDSELKKWKISQERYTEQLARWLPRSPRQDIPAEGSKSSRAEPLEKE